MSGPAVPTPTDRRCPPQVPAPAASAAGPAGVSATGPIALHLFNSSGPENQPLNCLPFSPSPLATNGCVPGNSAEYPAGGRAAASTCPFLEKHQLLLIMKPRRPDPGPGPPPAHSGPFRPFLCSLPAPLPPQTHPPGSPRWLSSRRPRPDQVPPVSYNDSQHLPFWRCARWHCAPPTYINIPPLPCPGDPELGYLLAPGPLFQLKVGKVLLGAARRLSGL